MDTFNIIKRNRKYFEAKKDGYDCKILIDKNSEGLELGEHTLAVEDISIRSQYGVDLKYKLKASAAEQQSAGICTLKTPSYNALLVEKCRALGGKWDPDARAWVFSGIVSDEIEALDEIYNSDPVAVELTAKSELSAWHAPVDFLGFSLARATGRDSGAKLADGVALMSGKIASGGSMKNWATVIRDGSVLRLEVPRALIDSAEQDDFLITLL